MLSLYNPRSKGRDWQLGKVKEMLLEHEAPGHARRHRKGRKRPTQQVLLRGPRPYARKRGYAYYRRRRELPDEGRGAPGGCKVMRSIFAVTDACAGCERW